MLAGMRMTHKNALISARRWLNSYTVTVDLPGADGIMEFTFNDHGFMHGDNPVGMLVETICSLPWQQQIPLVCLMGDLLDREKRHNAVLGSEMLTASTSVTSAMLDTSVPVMSLE